MDLNRFTALLAEHGADVGRWPAGEQAAARQLLSVSEAALELQRRAALIDGAFGAVPSVDAELSDRVLHRLSTVPLEPAPRQRSFAVPPIGAAAAAIVIAVIGVAAGASDWLPAGDVVEHFNLLGFAANPDVISGFGM